MELISKLLEVVRMGIRITLYYTSNWGHNCAPPTPVSHRHDHQQTMYLSIPELCLYTYIMNGNYVYIKKYYIIIHNICNITIYYNRNTNTNVQTPQTVSLHTDTKPNIIYHVRLYHTYHLWPDIYTDNKCQNHISLLICQALTLLDRAFWPRGRCRAGKRRALEKAHGSSGNFLANTRFPRNVVHLFLGICL